MNIDDLRALPATVDLETAGRVLGIGRSLAYDLARRDQFPTPVLRLGRVLRVPSAPLLELLGIEKARDGPPAGGRPLGDEAPTDRETESS